MIVRMRRFSLVVLLAGSACGRLHFGPAPDGPDEADPYRDLVVADTPLAYWRLADTGSIAVDDMGNTDGTYVGDCEQAAPGAFAGNAAVAFRPNAPRCMVTFGSAFEFAARAPFTVEAWISPTDAFPFGHVFSRQLRGAGSPLEGYAILESPIGVYGERIVASGNSSTSPSVVAANAFSHVALVYDGDAITLYTNGIAGAPKPDPSSATEFTATTMIGCATFEVNCFEGTIDEVAIYARDLSAATIAAHHAARSP